jgi:hypothetical protein
VEEKLEVFLRNVLKISLSQSAISPSERNDLDLLVYKFVINKHKQMGIEFRGSYYKRDVSFGKRTVKDGEAVAVWNRLGVHREVVGPRLVRLFFSTIVFLDKRIAGPNEYLVVTNVDGTVEHIRGPTTLYENPVFHRSVAIKSAFSLKSASECVVVNRETRESSTITKNGALIDNSRIDRMVIYGPNLYFPLVGDSIVEFKWSGNSSAVRAVDTFTVLSTASRQWKVDLPFHVISGGGGGTAGASTATVRGTVQVTLCFSIADVPALLDNSSDLIGDLYDAMVVDMAAIGASDAARREVNAKNLSKIMTLFTSVTDAFPHLSARAAATGIVVNGFAYRGFEPDQALARYLSELDEVEARIYRDRVLAEQEEKRIQADLSARQARLQHEQSLQQAQLAADKDRLAAEQEYRHAVAEHAMRESDLRVQAEIVRMREVNDEALRVLSSLNGMGVDLTTLLTNKPSQSAGSEGEKTNDTRGMTLVTKIPALTDVFVTSVEMSGASEMDRTPYVATASSAKRKSGK